MIQYARLPRRRARLAYEVRGQGAPLLLLRPLGGTMVSWGRFADILASYLRVIVFDFLGSGYSSRGPLVTSTRAMAADARALLDSLAIARAHLYGISMGGMVATWLALDAPERVDKLVLASTPPCGAGISLRGTPQLLRLAACLLRPAAEAESCVALRIMRPELRQSRPRRARAAALAARAGRPSRLTLVSHACAVLRHDVHERLGDLEPETLVLMGQYDPLLNAAALQSLLSQIPRVTFAAVEGAGHDLSTDKPAETAAEILSWLAAR